MSPNRFVPSGRWALINSAPMKKSIRVLQTQFYNNLTRRNIELAEQMPAKQYCYDLKSANLASLRLFRYACRMLPFIIRVHEIPHRVTPVQSKRYVANWFRKYSKETQLLEINRLIQWGYEITYQAEMHYSNTGYLHKFIMSPIGKLRDFGYNTFDDKMGDRINKSESSQFLNNFYKGRKSHNN